MNITDRLTMVTEHLGDLWPVSWRDTARPRHEQSFVVRSHPDPQQRRPNGDPYWISAWHRMPSDLDRLAAQTIEQSQQWNEYYGVNLGRADCQPSQRHRLKQADIVVVPGLLGDFDGGWGAHKGEALHLPDTLDALLAFLHTLPTPPSLIVDTGGGVHTYHLFQQPWVLATPEDKAAFLDLAVRFQETVEALAGTQHGWTSTSIFTTDLTRVLRLPGTISHKYNTLVTTIEATGLRYAIEDFLTWLPPRQTPPRAKGRKSKHRQIAGDSGTLDLWTLAEHYGMVLSKKSDSEWCGAHPVHGSDTGTNVNINPTDQKWHCFRHGSGGGSLLFLAVCEGIIDCTEAKSGGLRGEAYVTTVEIANTQWQAGIVLDERLARLDAQAEADDALAADFGLCSQSSLCSQEEEKNGEPVSTPPNRLCSQSSLCSQDILWPTLREEAWHGVAKTMIDVIRPQSEADPVALLAQLLTYASVVMGRKAYYVVERTRHYPNLHMVCVGKTSKGRKGTAYDHIEYTFRTVDTSWSPTHNVVSGCGSGEGVIHAVRDRVVKREAIKTKGKITGYHDVEADPGVVDKRLMIHEPEFASVLKVCQRDGSILSMTLRQAWDSGKLQNTIKNSPERATNAHVGCIGHITVEEVKKLLATTDMANGFANRFLWFCIKRSNILPDGGNLADTDFQPILDALRQSLHAIQDGPMRRDAEAAAAWRAVYPTLSDSQPGLAGAILGRGEAQVLRLSMVYALLDSSMEIRAPHLLAALALWEYVEDSVAYIFGTTTGNPHADTLADALQGATEGTMTKREIIREVFHGHIKAHELNEAIRLLVGRGLVTREFAASQGGRRAEKIRYGQKGEYSEQDYNNMRTRARYRYTELAQDALATFRESPSLSVTQSMSCEQSEQSEQSRSHGANTGYAEKKRVCEQSEQSEQSGVQPCLHEHVNDLGECNDCGELLGGVGGGPQ